MTVCSHEAQRNAWKDCALEMLALVVDVKANFSREQELTRILVKELAGNYTKEELFSKLDGMITEDFSKWISDELY